ncbi:MAG: hypothetical protein JXA99_00300 [Candidatus Lokiarchaeota archaeon]|nr:hypothetical protein [Candidatus Lokiarchaeota archaeon]
MSKFNQTFKISEKKMRDFSYNLTLKDPYKIKAENINSYDVNYYCEYCGENLTKDMKFCPMCYNPIKSEIIRKK